MTLPAGIIKTGYPDGRIVNHLGALNLPAGNDPKQPYHVPPYSDGALNFTKGQYWGSQATDRTNCPIVVRRTPAQIVAAKRMFPFGDTGVPLGLLSGYKFNGPMDSAGIEVYMPETGERRDIGLVTDASGQFMRTGDPGPMLVWAQAAESWPFHFRDEKTGKPADLLKYPTMNCYLGNQGGPHLELFPLNTNWAKDGDEIYLAGGDMKPQQAHFPELSYMAHIATLDAGFLSNLQYQANYLRLTDAAKSSPAGSIISGEMRGIAWAFRHMFMAHIATKDFEAKCIADGVPFPDDLMPSSYFKTLLDNDLNYYKAKMADPANQVFRLVPGVGGIFAPWQCDYMLMALAFGVLTGHSDWAPLFLWALKNVIDRARGDRGYPLGMGGGAYFESTQPNWLAALKYLYARAAVPGDDRYDARFTAAQLAALIADPFNGGDPVNGWHTAYDPNYHINTRAVLVMAQYLHKLGLVDVKAVYPELDQCFATMDCFIRANAVMVPRASYVLDAIGVPATLPPPPVTPPPTATPPSTGEIIVSAIAFNAPFTATASFKDNKGNSMVPDTVTWDGPVAFKITADQTDKLKAHGVYGAEGLNNITATGVKDGISVTAVKGVTVPAAVPFLAAGSIELS